MVSTDELLRQYQPVLKYDSQEAYFADSAAEWTDNPGNLLRSAANQQLALAGSGLSLELLAQMVEGGRANQSDVLSDPDPAKDYARQAALLHVQAKYANQIYGRAVVEGEALWLQYWFYYFYNDYNLIGTVIKAGLHECDWEMIELRLSAGLQTPDLAVYAQHSHADSRDWRQVDLLPGSVRPLVYPARGSHASYFEPGTHWTGYWFDYADGKRRSPDQTLNVVRDDDPAWLWMRWPGYWGDTKKGELPIDSDSPRGPGCHGQWDQPSALLDLQPPATPPDHPGTLAAPWVRAEWADHAITLHYSVAKAPDGRLPTALVVTINSPDDNAPPRTETHEITYATGAIDVGAGADPTHRYDIYVSCAARGEPPLASPSVRVDVDPA